MISTGLVRTGTFCISTKVKRGIATLHLAALRDLRSISRGIRRRLLRSTANPLESKILPHLVRQHLATFPTASTSFAWAAAS